MNPDQFDQVMAGMASAHSRMFPSLDDAPLGLGDYSETTVWSFGRDVPEITISEGRADFASGFESRESCVACVPNCQPREYTLAEALRLTRLRGLNGLQIHSFDWEIVASYPV